MIYLVRHADAGDKRLWRAPDVRRPLSMVGLQQARRLAGTLGWAPVTAVVSSPAVRCVQTVHGLARHRRLPVVIDPRLRVGADVPATLAMLLSPASDGAVLCTHGELIEDLFRALRDCGAPIDTGAQWPKGCTWLLDTTGGRVNEAAYLPPPSTVEQEPAVAGAR
jgi:8-oxo-dGTP diphosphatase